MISRFNMIRILSALALIGGAAEVAKAADQSALPVHCVVRKMSRIDPNDRVKLLGGGTIAPCKGDEFAIYAPMFALGSMMDTYIHADDYLIEKTGRFCFYDRSALEVVIRKLIEARVCKDTSLGSRMSSTVEYNVGEN